METTIDTGDYTKQAGHYLVVRNGDLYLVSSAAYGGSRWFGPGIVQYPDDSPDPSMTCLFWYIGRYAHSTYHYDDPTGATITGMRVRENRFGSTFEYTEPGRYSYQPRVVCRLAGDQKADLVETHLLPAPKLRGSQECRWQYGHWEIRSKSTNWRTV